MHPVLKTLFYLLFVVYSAYPEAAGINSEIASRKFLLSEILACGDVR